MQGDRIGKVFKDETDKDVIEGFRRERRIKEVGLPQLHVRETRSVDDSLRLGKGVSEMSTDRKDAPGLLVASASVWAPVPHPASRTRLPSG